MTTYYTPLADVGAVLDALERGSQLFSGNDEDRAWIAHGDGRIEPLDWPLFEQLINRGSLLPVSEPGRTRWSLPDKVGLRRYAL
jgi:hypothetical protein